MVAAKLAYLMRGVATAVFAGSLPRDVPEDWYATALRDARRARLQTVLDSEGEPLPPGGSPASPISSPRTSSRPRSSWASSSRRPHDFAAGHGPHRRHGRAQRDHHARHRLRGADQGAGQDAPAVGRDRAARARLRGRFGRRAAGRLPRGRQGNRPLDDVLDTPSAAVRRTPRPSVRARSTHAMRRVSRPPSRCASSTPRPSRRRPALPVWGRRGRLLASSSRVATRKVG